MTLLQKPGRAREAEGSVPGIGSACPPGLCRCRVARKWTNICYFFLYFCSHLQFLDLKLSFLGVLKILGSMHDKKLGFWCSYKGFHICLQIISVHCIQVSLFQLYVPCYPFLNSTDLTVKFRFILPLARFFLFAARFFQPSPKLYHIYTSTTREGASHLRVVRDKLSITHSFFCCFSNSARLFISNVDFFLGKSPEFMEFLRTKPLPVPPSPPLIFP